MYLAKITPILKYGLNIIQQLAKKKRKITKTLGAFEQVQFNQGISKSA
jgi:hypothetical protein